MSLEAKTIKAPSPAELERLLQQEVGKGWRPIDNPGRLLHDGKSRDGEEWVQHLQRRV